MKKLGRRRFLRGAGGAAVALPFLGAMSERASADVFPKRFIAFFTGLGTVRSAWTPVGTESQFILGEVLSPLAPFQDKLLILDGIDMESSYHGPGDPHQQGIAQALTGTELQEGNLFQYACNPGKTVGWGGGISLDQHLANHIGQNTKLPSLELGVQVQYANVSSRVSYQGPGAPVPPDDDPSHVFTRVFGDLGADPLSVAILREKRHRVLDAVLEDYGSLAKRLGPEDKIKVDNHLAAIHEIDKRLDAPGGIVGGACASPVIAAPQDLYDNDAYPALGKLQMDLLAMAFACDLTRVATLQWTTVQAGKVFTWLGQSQPHHALSHSGDGDTISQNQLIAIGRWHSEQLAYLMGKLAAIPEGNGSVLDNTVILWCTDIAAGNTHERRSMPYVVAGNAGGYFKSGRHLTYGGAMHNDLLVSLCQAMDVDVSTFGNPAYCTGPLSGLTG